mgnify:CR=1 FL=1
MGKSTIDQMLSDPKFRQLMKANPDRARALVLEVRQKDFGKIPNTGKLLDLSRPSRSFQQDLPQVAFQTGQGLLENLPQNIIENPRTFVSSGIPGVQFKSGAMLPDMIRAFLDKRGGGTGQRRIEPETTEFSEKYLEPNTAAGKAVGLAGNIVTSFLSPAAMLAGPATKSLRTGHIRKEIKSIEDLISTSRKSEVPLKEKVSQIGRVSKILTSKTKKKAGKLAYEGGKEVIEKGDKLFDVARENYKSLLSGVNPRNVSFDDVIKTIDKTLEAKGSKVAEFMSPQERNLMSLKNELLGYGKKIEAIEEIRDPVTNTIIQQGQKASSELPKFGRAQELKNIQDKAYQAMSGNKNIEGEFLHNFGIMLEKKGANGLTKANANYRKAYKTYDQAKSVRKGSIKRVALDPNIPESEVIDLMKAEQGIGTKNVSKARDIARKNKLQQHMLGQKEQKFQKGLLSEQSKQEALKSRIPGLERDIKDTRFRQGLTAAVGGTFGIGQLIRSIFGVENKR